MKTQPQTRIAILFLVALAIFVVPNVSAQNQTKQQRQFQAPPQTASDPIVSTVIVSPGEEYLIGPSDVILIDIADAPELSHSYRIGADGSIEMPVLGRVSAQQKTTRELSKIIADGLRGEYLNDPQVNIIVEQINSRTYFIQGAVRRPGLYQVEGRPSLLMLITIAGGLGDNYGSTAFVIHKIKPATNEVSSAHGKQEQPTTGNASAASSENDAGEKPGYELFKVNINGLLRGNLDHDVVIEPGDIVHIPMTDVFFVAGEVNSPGSFPLKDGTTLRQAISLAQGTNFSAAANRGVIFRENPNNGTRQEIKVDITAVMNGKSQDVPIMPNDIVIVPNSRLRSVASTLLRAFNYNSTRVPIRY